MPPFGMNSIMNASGSAFFEKATSMTKLAPYQADQVSIVVEIAYFDEVSELNESRIAHSLDAIRLYYTLREKTDFNNIFCDVFVNDISINEAICGIDKCDDVDLHHSDSEKNQRIRQVIRSQLNELGVGDLEYEVFMLKNTRNRAVKSIKKALKRGVVDGEGVIETRKSDLIVDVFADNGMDRILLASKSRINQALLPRCTAIMAQHYYDLMKFSVQRNPSSRCLILFDFNNPEESARVSLGAEATFVVCEWPDATRARIINCVHNSFDSEDTKLVITSN